MDLCLHVVRKPLELMAVQNPRRYGQAEEREDQDAWTMLIQGMDTDGIYQKYRDFLGYIPILEMAGFDLIAIERPPNNPAGMYVFRKKNPVESHIN